MGFEFKGTFKFDILGKYQDEILDAVSKALPGAAADYAPLPNGRVALIVIWPGFANRSDEDRKQLVNTSIIASLRINPDDYLAGIICWTPREQQDIRKAVESPPGPPRTD